MRISIRWAVLLAVLCFVSLAACSSGGGSPAAQGTSTHTSGSSGKTSGGGVATAKGPDSVTNLCSLYSVAEASAAVGVPLRNEPEGSGRFHKICFYVAVSGAATAPDVEIHLFKSSAARTLFDQAGKAQGEQAVAGLGNGAHAGPSGLEVLLDETHYFTVSTGLHSDTAKTVAIAKVLLTRLGY